MVTAAEMKRFTARWARVTNRLPAQDVKYGIDIVRFVEKANASTLAYFDDPVEAAMVLACLGVIQVRKEAKDVAETEATLGLDKWLLNNS